MVFNENPFAVTREGCLISELKFPKNFSDNLLKDLFFKLLREIPILRLSLSEIKVHPWVLKKVTLPYPELQEEELKEESKEEKIDTQSLIDEDSKFSSQDLSFFKDFLKEMNLDLNGNWKQELKEKLVINPKDNINHPNNTQDIQFPNHHLIDRIHQLESANRKLELQLSKIQN